MIHDLEAQLIQKGISPSHIGRMKIETNELLDQKSEQYELDTKAGQVTELVPVDRIKALIIRGGKGVSWFDHVRFYDRLENSFTRMKDNFDLFLASDLKSYYDYFADGRTCTYAFNWENTLQFNHYVDENIYTVKYGNHRATLAKVTGVPIIEAKVSKWYKK